METAYEWLGDTALALEYYRKAGLWQECLFIATGTAMDVSALAAELASALIEAKDYCTAGRIHLDYRSDVEEGVRLLCKGNAFSEAMRIVCVITSDASPS
jgi:elongator complex protein 1